MSPRRSDGAVVHAVPFGLRDDGEIAVGDPVEVHVWSDPDGNGDLMALLRGWGTCRQDGPFGERRPITAGPRAESSS